MLSLRMCRRRSATCVLVGIAAIVSCQQLGSRQLRAASNIKAPASAILVALTGLLRLLKYPLIFARRRGIKSITASIERLQRLGLHKMQRTQYAVQALTASAGAAGQNRITPR
ncbi:hypothetical protein BG74_01350 [Sodalis-like endosymbiont of Proechinophthirus fluctus]|nr:hypothetical protein BG74_01350 [Sodalis-like endosymbiont of Proechinophthirus fluctus]